MPQQFPLSLPSISWTRIVSSRRSRQLLGKTRIQANRLRRSSASEFSAKVADFRQLVQNSNNFGIPLIAQSFALTNEALRRIYEIEFYDCQLLAGLALTRCQIAEMQTGEGKTITCGLAAALHAMTGKGVHVSTTNGYLAERDYKELEPVFELLQLSTGHIDPSQDAEKKRAAYQADVTYGPGYEFGFDFLRDQAAIANRQTPTLGTQYIGRLRGVHQRQQQPIQRSRYFAIVDEADSVLIDEANSPLVLSGQEERHQTGSEVYQSAQKTALQLSPDQHFVIDHKKRSIKFTKSGWNRIHNNLSQRVVQNLSRPWAMYVEQALKANLFFEANREYVVADKKVVIVDDNTGRLHEERSWRDGLHQALETKHGLAPSAERTIDARISRQRFYNFYEKLSGLTGTATGSEKEFANFYDLKVVKIERNHPSLRIQKPTRYFSSFQSLYKSLVDHIRSRPDSQQPILIGTRSIEQSLEISKYFSENRIGHSLLNGTQDETESAIIAKAGDASAITIATNMAGRGTDIKLQSQSAQAGGLHVIAIGHHESTRVDRQLIGRSARQNDPGSCQFFVAANDEIFSRHQESLSKRILAHCQATSEGHSNRKLDEAIGSLQLNIESELFHQRRLMFQQDQWLETVQSAVAKTA